LRKYSDESVSEATIFGFLHLDLIAQEKGYTPVAAAAWDVMS